MLPAQAMQDALTSIPSEIYAMKDEKAQRVDVYILVPCWQLLKHIKISKVRIQIIGKLISEARK